MTRLLDQALSKLRELPASEQDAIAALILEEIEDDRRWDEQFGRSEDQLADLARKTREDIRAGRTRDQGFDDL